MNLLLALGQRWAAVIPVKTEHGFVDTWPWYIPIHLIYTHLCSYTYATWFYEPVRHYKKWGCCWQWGWERDMQIGLKRMVQTIHIRRCERGTCRRVGSEHICQKCTVKLCWDCFPRNAPQSHCLLTGSLSSISHNSEIPNLNIVTGMQVWMNKYIRMAIWIYLWW